MESLSWKAVFDKIDWFLLRDKLPELYLYLLELIEYAKELHDIHKNRLLEQSIRNSACFQLINVRECIQLGASFAIPSSEAIRSIVGFAKKVIEEKRIPDGNISILEIGSGMGLWARLIEMTSGTSKLSPLANNVSVWCTDTGVPSNSRQHKRSFRDGHLQTIADTNAAILMLCWPNYGKPDAAESIEAFKGEYLIYIGEWEEGCCADTRFFDILKHNWQILETIEIPCFPGNYDQVYILKRNSQ
jgi:hypothetical protein